VRDTIEAFAFQRRLRLLGHVRQLRAVGADFGHLVRDDQLMLGRADRRRLLPVGAVHLVQLA
jgi:hypothetical protein